jgi:hypothetical protein
VQNRHNVQVGSRKNQVAAAVLDAEREARAPVAPGTPEAL